MMTHSTAFELSRQRVEFASQRATLLAALGTLPKAQTIFPFRRRQAMPLAGTVEVRHYTSETERIRRRLDNLAAAQRKAS